ncbi:sugar phosphate isomerase/epimerase family protein [Planctomycetota bacterium]
MIPSIWTGMYGGLPLGESFKALQACGWDVFEISSEHLVKIELDTDPEALIAEAVRTKTELGVQTPQAHALLKAELASPDMAANKEDLQRVIRHIEIAAQLEVKDIVVHTGGRGGYTTRLEFREILDRNIEAFNRLGDAARDKGMRVCVENLGRRGICTSDDMLAFLEAADHPALGIVLDTSHANLSGLDLPAMVRELGSNLIATHISDNDGSGDQHLIPGGGNIDWTAVVESLREIGYTGLFNLEIPGARHPDPELKRMKTRFARQVTGFLLGEETESL